MGIIIAWVYLRWFQSRDGIQGDHSREFSMASFFPEFLQGFVDGFAEICKRCCFFWLPKKQTNTSSLVTATNTTTTTHNGPLSSSPAVNSRDILLTVIETKDEDVERRRKLGIKALDERLSQMKQFSSPVVMGSSLHPSVPEYLK
eukprot:TRINITY_DN1009_c0_g1_i7.p1 TRINITY_DN1009_c0_g1~~TRINITY_DN1009_c0_g1_i7.p1  ORF type:complete len:145 (-),score=31.67 TRINITY_DN1009_c0_g1_i7:74-508(-)